MTHTRKAIGRVDSQRFPNWVPRNPWAPQVPGEEVRASAGFWLDDSEQMKLIV